MVSLFQAVGNEIVADESPGDLFDELKALRINSKDIPEILARSIDPKGFVCP